MEVRIKVDLNEVFYDLDEYDQKKAIVELFETIATKETAYEALQEMFESLPARDRERFIDNNVDNGSDEMLTSLIETTEDLDLINEIERRGYTVTKDKEDEQ